jgi:hypothetical protein
MTTNHLHQWVVVNLFEPTDPQNSKNAPKFLYRNIFTGTSALTTISTLACGEVKRRIESIPYKR